MASGKVGNAVQGLPGVLHLICVRWASRAPLGEPANSRSFQAQESGVCYPNNLRDIESSAFSGGECDCEVSDPSDHLRADSCFAA